MPGASERSGLGTSSSVNSVRFGPKARLVRVTVPSILLSAERLDDDGSLRSRLDPGSIHFGDVDEDANDVDLRHDKQRLSTRIGRQNEIASIDVPLDDDSGVRHAEVGIFEHRIHPAQVGFGVLDRCSGHGQIGVGLGKVGFPFDQQGFGRRDPGFDLAARRLGGVQLVAGLVGHLPIDGSRLGHFGDSLVLGFPSLVLALWRGSFPRWPPGCPPARSCTAASAAWMAAAACSTLACACVSWASF